MLIAVFLIPALTLGATAPKAKDLVLQKAVNVGVKAMDKPAMNKTCTCVEPDVLACKDIMSLGTKAVSCVMSESTAMQKMAIMACAPGLMTCLATTGGSQMATVFTDVASVLLPEVTRIYGKICAQNKKLKTQKKTNPFMLNASYGSINSEVNKKYIGVLVCAIAKKVESKVFKCLVQQGKPIIDLSTYECGTTGQKSSLLG